MADDPHPPSIEPSWRAVLRSLLFGRGRRASPSHMHSRHRWHSHPNKKNRPTHRVISLPLPTQPSDSHQQQCRPSSTPSPTCLTPTMVLSRTSHVRSWSSIIRNIIRLTSTPSMPPSRRTPKPRPPRNASPFKRP